jgi:cation:H+ antiporter
LTFFILNLMGGLALLYLGGELMVRGSASLGLRLGMTPLLTGLTIVAFGTSAPELVVSLQAALNGKGGLAVGNVVGSNICNIALILGISTLVRPIKVDARLVRHDVPIMLVCTLLMVVMLLDGKISRLDGVTLLLCLAAFVAYTVRDSRSTSQRVRAEFQEAVRDVDHSVIKSVLITMGGLGLLVWGGGSFVTGAIGFSEAFGIAPAVIGLSVAAVGTSLPELATSVVAAMRGYGDMAAGNVVGSNIFNILSVLGVTSTVSPLNSGAVTMVDLGVMLAFSFVSMRLLGTQWVMERWEGALLVTGFVVYMTWLFV